MGVAVGVMISGLAGLFVYALVLEGLDRKDGFREARLQRAEPASRAREGAVVKVVVRLQHGPREETSLLAEESCVAWNVEVEALGAGGWSKAWSETGIGAPRGLSDDGTDVSLDTSSVRIAWEHDPGGWRAPNPAVLERLGAKRPSGQLRCREARLRAGDTVAVLGVARWRGGGGSEYREAERELVLSGDRTHPLLVSARAEHRR